MMIQSHYKPYKSLKSHVSEVNEAAESILKSHSDETASLINNWIDYAIQFHDLGKAIREFQQYIKDPKKYKGITRGKAHAPVSLFWWCAYAQNRQIEPSAFIAVAAVVWKHHGDFPTFSDYDGLESSLDLYDGIIQEQLDGYPLDAIREQLKINLPELEYDDVILTEFFHDHRPEKLNIEDAAFFRLKVQFLFSVLMEADRAFLALSDNHLNKYLSNKTEYLSVELIDQHLKTKEKPEFRELNELRNEIRRDVIKNVAGGISTVTLPTGMGKTMIAASWALKHFKIYKRKEYRKIIIVLPFLSIIDQTVKEYWDLFQEHNPEKLILEAHSLAERQYCDDADENERNKINNSLDFLTETWQKQFVITTFDQFLLALLSSKGRHQLLFHNLVDSIIIMDEIQAVSTQLWKPISLSLNALADKLNTKILIMSATQPGFIKTAKDLVPNPKTVFSTRKRYRLALKFKKEIPIADFIKDCRKRLKNEWRNKRIMIVLNTRAAAREILDELMIDIDVPWYLLSADVIPQERLDNIEKIKKNEPCLAVTTQCIEAGVDIDMDFIIRDFAPFDSIIQVAGRCNRNGTKPRCDIEIVKLLNNNGREFYKQVYKDNILIESTFTILNSVNNNELLEEDIFPFIKSYYDLLKGKIDTGNQHAQNWAFWEKEIDVRKLLRGDNKKHDFLVIHKDEPKKNELPLHTELVKALEIEDRWERKRSIRALRGRIARLTVSIWAKPGFDPLDISEQLGSWYLLKEEYYEARKGISLKNTRQASLIL